MPETEKAEDWASRDKVPERSSIGVTLVYNPEPEREGTRSYLARGLLYLLTFMIGGVLAFIGFGLLDGSALTQSIFPSVVTLVGTALGFYFGTRQSENQRQQGGTASQLPSDGVGGAPITPPQITTPPAANTSSRIDPPLVEITEPVEGDSFAASAAIVISADAVGGGGKALAKVDFFDGDSLIGTSTVSPYSLTWTTAKAGTHTLKAVATDELGVAMESMQVTITMA